MAKYRFEQIALNSTEKKKPVAEDRFTYLGLEHLDSGSLKITRFGADVAPTGEKLVMRKGDVLFGKRRAYQKKVAIAPFDGIFSAHGMVLRPKEDVITKNFFPLFISSDYFLDAAIKLSVGSLSPTINWRDLKELEFDLPTLDVQRELAEVLWSITDTMEAYKRLLSATDALVKSQFIEMFGDPVKNPFGWNTRPFLSMGYCKNGMNFHTGDSGIKMHCLGVGDFKDYSIVDGTDHLPMISLKETPPEESMLQDGDILFVRSNGNKALVGRSLVVYPRNTPTTYSGFCIRYRLTNFDVNITYLLCVLKTDSIRKKMMGRGANIQNLNQQILATLDIPTPPIDLQEQFVAFVHQTDKSKFAALTCLHQMMRDLQARIGKTAFGASRANHVL